MMNKLVPGAYFSVRAAENQRFRKQTLQRSQGLPGSAPTDMRIDPWSLAAQGFRKNDPDGRKLIKLLLENE